MSSPSIHPVVTPPLSPQDVGDRDLLYKFLYELWVRTGGKTSTNPDLKGLDASVGELNTLLGIKIDESVQDQLNKRPTFSSFGSMAYQNASAVAITGGTINNATIENSLFSSGIISESTITIPVNTTSLNLNLGATINTTITPVGNVGAGEDTLISYALLADVLGENSQYLEVSAWGTLAANANNKRIKLKFGSTTILDTTSVAANGGSWIINSKIVRLSSASQQIISTIISDNSLIVNQSSYVDGTENTATSLDVFCTGEATANDDIVQKGQIIKWYKT